VTQQNITRDQLSQDGIIRRYGTPDTAIEYRVTPAGVFESGNPGSAGFWRLTPEIIFTRSVSTDESSLRGLQIIDIEVEYDGTTYATEAGAKSSEISDIDYSARVSNPIKNFTGTSGAKWAVIQILNDDTAGPAQRQAAADELIDSQGESTTLTLSVDNHPTFPTICEPGDYVWIYDPDTGLANTGNQVLFAGKRLTPVKVRVYGTRWPVMEGRGVYYANNDWSTIVDLGPYMEWEDGPVDIEAGAPLRAGFQLNDAQFRRLL